MATATKRSGCVRADTPTPGVFDQLTRPTQAQVTAWLAQISAVLDAYLLTKGVPLRPTSNAALDLFITAKRRRLLKASMVAPFRPTSQNKKNSKAAGYHSWRCEPTLIDGLSLVKHCHGR